MVDRWLADLVLAAHFGFVLFALAGGLLALRSRRWLWLHLPAAFWALAVEACDCPCPLTGLELRLRRQAGEQGFATSCLDRFLGPVLYPDGLTREVQLWLALGVVVANLGVYAFVFQRRRRRARSGATRAASGRGGSASAR